MVFQPYNAEIKLHYLEKIREANIIHRRLLSYFLRFLLCSYIPSANANASRDVRIIVLQVIPELQIKNGKWKDIKCFLLFERMLVMKPVQREHLWLSLIERRIWDWSA